VVIVEPFIVVEKVAVGATVNTTPVELSAGVTAVTVGGVNAAVVNTHTASFTSALPARSFAPPLPPFTVAVYCVLKLRGDDGCKVTVLLGSS
jgi:hypothetical protein